MTGVVAIQSLLDESHHGPAGYTAKAVQFTGWNGFNGMCGLKCPSISCTNNGWVSFACWLKVANWSAPDSSTYIWMSDSVVQFQPFFYQNGSPPPHSQWSIQHTKFQGYSNFDVHMNNGAWNHLICSMFINAPPTGSGVTTNKKVGIVINGSNGLDLNATDSTTAGTFSCNGKDFWLADDGYGDSFTCLMADFSFWPGVNFLNPNGTNTIDPTIIPLFRDTFGNPVDPAVAIAALGAPAVMATNGLSGFLANSLGTSGSLSVPSGYDSPLDTSDHP